MLTLRGYMIPAEKRLDMFGYQAPMSDDALKATNFLTALWTTPRLEEVIIIGLLIIAIGIGAAVLINQRKIKKQLRELLDQKEDKPNDEI